MGGTALQNTSKKRQHEPGEDQDKRKRRRGSATYLYCVWFAWYAQEPRIWQSAIFKQQKSDAKLLVAFMKLYVSDGFVLDTTVPDYRDQVLTLSKHAEAPPHPSSFWGAERQDRAPPAASAKDSHPRSRTWIYKTFSSQ
ncbi:hypothetical protein PPTG_06865 [Phytophthora nicotianae INRA-310]|uniref:Uncharacterized protein n=1 Tax=Phytophthora nicotianae (strain INRA-310) TaxID=761204 RepID=W2QTM2_PHYN3|nr:hypothetical protein PPTG_06865 [Phytophthora nicotianae INRA-310]ETN15630.1 hypothetical protein PPTG_06865 [Phytophthora nicotianae INRA-310]